jgi:serine/threonine protein kinase
MALTSVVSTGYAPFEQYHEDGNQGPGSDIYALAAVMYRAITGRKPPEATRRLKDDPIEKLTARYAGKYDAEFLRAIDKALAVNERKRPQTIAEWTEMFGPDDRLPLDSDETRLLPRRKTAKSWAQTLEPLLQSPRALTIGAGAAVVLLLGALWLITRPKPHEGGSQIKNDVVAVSPVPTPESSQPPQASPLPTAQVQPTAQQEIAEASPTLAPSPELSPGASVGFQLDPRLVGTWETKGRWPPNSTRTRTAHWIVQNDGHFTFSGPWSDAGAITAADGNMKWFSNNAAQPVDLTYEFDDDTLVTHGPLGDAKWTRTRHSSQQSGRSTRRGHTDPGDSIKREMFRRMFDRIRR